VTVRRSDIPQIGLEARRLGELLITPCPCAGGPDGWLKAHTLGEHLHDSTRNMAPGPKAQAFEPRTIVPSIGAEDGREPPPDPDLHARYTALAGDAWAALRALQAFVDSWRPDRNAPTGPTFSDDEWCTHHLDQLGICEPRYRGDLCRRCYGVHLTTGHHPPLTILQAWRDGTRVTDTTLAAAIRAEQQRTGKTKAKGKGKRRKAG